DHAACVDRRHPQRGAAGVAGSDFRCGRPLSCRAGPAIIGRLPWNFAMKRQRSPRLIVGGLLALAAIGIRMSGFAAAPEAFASQLPVATSEGEQHRQLLDRYCVSCHNQRLKTAGLTLDTLAVENLAADAATWEKVVRKL